MALYFYYVNFGISLLLALVYGFIFHKRFDASIMMMTVLVPIINLGFVMMGLSQTIDTALLALKLTYLGGCFLLVAVMFLIFNTCKVSFNPYLRVGVLLISTTVFLTVLTIGHADIFYVGIPDLAFADGAAYITNKHYGFMHTVFYGMVVVYYLATLGVIIYSFFRKKQVPRTVLILILLSVTIAIFGFFGSRIFHQSLEILPITYNLGMAIYLIVASRLRLYDVSDSVMETLVQKGDTGFVSFDHRLRYLGSNETAKEIFPELRGFAVDHRVTQYEAGQDRILPLIEKFNENEIENATTHFDIGDKVYLLRIEHLRIGGRNRGYQFLITDDTAREQLLRLMKNYSEQLEQEVEEKTEHIQQIQNRFVLGMATMVEGRDNSTGGHIKRTSDVVAFLVEELKRAEYPGVDETFCRNLIRSAPMHDLGKITIDDAILRKPGKFTPEEFEIMKTHAAEGARIIAEITKGTTEKEFADMAIDVAHYHHERWDGSGYPCKLSGTDIPFAARVMAVADVYDALVSKRVYKEKMSFEEANRIILDGMGTQFDPSLKPHYLAVREKLEAYYQGLGNKD